MNIYKEMGIYVLKLERNKYYIGRSGNVQDRIEAHIQGNGCEYTKRYKVKKVIEIIETEDLFEEDKVTKRYMSKFGIDHVRGGSYTTLELSKEVKDFLRKEIYAGTNRCYQCGLEGHYMRDCLQNENEKEEEEVKENEVKVIDLVRDIASLWLEKTRREMIPYLHKIKEDLSK